MKGLALAMHKWSGYQPGMDYSHWDLQIAWLCELPPLSAAAASAATLGSVCAAGAAAAASALDDAAGIDDSGYAPMDNDSDAPSRTSPPSTPASRARAAPIEPSSGGSIQSSMQPRATAAQTSNAHQLPARLLKAQRLLVWAKENKALAVSSDEDADDADKDSPWLTSSMPHRSQEATALHRACQASWYSVKHSGAKPRRCVPTDTRINRCARPGNKARLASQLRNIDEELHWVIDQEFQRKLEQEVDDATAVPMEQEAAVTRSLRSSHAAMHRAQQTSREDGTLTLGCVCVCALGVVQVRRGCSDFTASQE